MRKIIHIDMDAFYASVEQRDQPALRGKPVAVGGSGLRGVVASASYEARTFGVRSAMPSVTARRLCPDLIFVKARFDVYREVSRQIREIFYEYTDLVEPLSLDEAYLDVTENKKGMISAMRIAMEIRKKIEETTRLTASAGVSFNKFLAKTASDINKPDGMKTILPEEAAAFLDALPVEKFHGIGKVTASKMHRMGLYTGKDLKKLSKLELAQRFGKAGQHFYRIVRSEDDRPVKPDRGRKSIGAERTFSENLSRPQDMKEHLGPLVEKVFGSIKKQQNYGRTVTLKMKSADFQIYTRSRTFTGEIRELSILEKAVFDLLDEHWQEAAPVRLLGLTVSNLQREHFGEGVQLEFEWEEE
jgi:DNA polymerase-4